MDIESIRERIKTGNYLIKSHVAQRALDELLWESPPRYCWRIQEQGEKALEMSDKLQFVAGLRPLVHCRKPRQTEVCRTLLNSPTVSASPKAQAKEEIVYEITIRSDLWRTLSGERMALNHIITLRFTAGRPAPGVLSEVQ